MLVLEASWTWTDRRVRARKDPAMNQATGRNVRTIGCIIVRTAALAMIASPTTATAAPNCMARILADVPAEEAPEQMKSKNSGTFGPITQIKVNKTSGKMVYCTKTSYCYGSNAFEITTPCRLKLDKSVNYGDYFSYFTR